VALAGLVAAALGAFAGLLWRGTSRLRASLVFAAAAALLVAVGARQALDLLVGNANTVDWVATLTVALAGWLAFGIAIRALLQGPGPRDPLPAPLTLLLLVCCDYVCLGLVFAGRHRDFPVWLFLPGGLGIALTAALGPLARAGRLQAQRATEEVLLAAWLVAAGCLIPLQEGFQNGRSIGWGALSLLLGSAILLPLALQARQHQRAAQHTDAGPREAVEHHADGADRDGQDGRGR
jgi:glucan 1,3-beta-glucosidase